MSKVGANQEVLGLGALMAPAPSIAVFAPRPADRVAVAVLVGIVWIGILSGFGTESFSHIRQFGLDYPLIVHVHALVFIGWLALVTAQLVLVRKSRLDLHKKLGMAGAALALVMLVLGPLTAISVSQRHYAVDGTPPVFLAVQFTTMAAFAALTIAALLLRRAPAAHKRLMLLGLIHLSTPGFARFLNGLVVASGALGLPPGPVQIYFSTDVLILAMGVYDLAMRRRLHPAYVLGAIGSLVLQTLALALLTSNAWVGVSLHLIGR